MIQEGDRRYEPELQGMEILQLLTEPALKVIAVRAA